MNDPTITKDMLDELRSRLESNFKSGAMSEKRYRHTLEVEKMAARLGEIYIPDKVSDLRAAGLLHDVTKELSTDKHIELAERFGIALSELDVCAPKTLHAMTATAVIGEEYREFATETVLGCVRWHTTGRSGMTLCEKLVYLADYIDMSRTFDDCVKLRSFFFCDELDSMPYEQKLEHLDRTLLLSYDMTLSGLIESGTPISPDTIAARNELAVKFCAKNKAEKKNKN